MKTNEEYLDIAKNYYKQDNKCYHTLFHIEMMLKLFDKFKVQFMYEFPDLDEDELKTAIIWHDSVYIPGNNDNEDKSMLLYSEYCSKTNESLSMKIVNAILSTKINNNYFTTSLEKVLHDLDWNYFFHDQAFNIAVEQIQYEAMQAGYSKDFVIKNQLKFYKSLNDKDIYITRTFKDLNEEARNNIKAKINELENININF